MNNYGNIIALQWIFWLYEKWDQQTCINYFQWIFYYILVYYTSQTWLLSFVWWIFWQYEILLDILVGMYSYISKMTTDLVSCILIINILMNWKITWTELTARVYWIQWKITSADLANQIFRSYEKRHRQPWRYQKTLDKLGCLDFYNEYFVNIRNLWTDLDPCIFLLLIYWWH